MRNRLEPGISDLAVCVSGMDGNNRMVYTDVRDRKGCAQPLAINEALRDAGRGQGSRDVPSSSQPRVIQELEQCNPGVPSESRPMPMAVSPYYLGKSTVQSRSVTASSQPAATAAKDPSAAYSPDGATKTR